MCGEVPLYRALEVLPFKMPMIAGLQRCNYCFVAVETVSMFSSGLWEEEDSL